MVQHNFSEVTFEWREYFIIFLCQCVFLPLLDGDYVLLYVSEVVQCLAHRESSVDMYGMNEWMSEWISGGDGPATLCTAVSPDPGRQVPLSDASPCYLRMTRRPEMLGRSLYCATSLVAELPWESSTAVQLGGEEQRLGFGSVIYPLCDLGQVTQLSMSEH